MIGPFINSLCIILGSVAGSLLSASLGAEFRRRIMLVFACISSGIGVYMIGKTSALPPVVLALLIGSILGELCRVEALFLAFATRVAVFFSRFGKRGGLEPEVMQEQFTLLAVIFCASSVGFFGAMQEGLTGDPSLLFIKALLDLPTAMFIAANIGAMVGVLALPQLAIQASVLICAGLFAQWTDPAMLGDFSGCGGFIMLATGLRMSGAIQFPILSMLPALLLAMPLSALWVRFLV